MVALSGAVFKTYDEDCSGLILSNAAGVDNGNKFVTPTTVRAGLLSSSISHLSSLSSDDNVLEAMIITNKVIRLKSFDYRILASFG